MGSEALPSAPMVPLAEIPLPQSIATSAPARPVLAMAIESCAEPFAKVACERPIVAPLAGELIASAVALVTTLKITGLPMVVLPLARCALSNILCWPGLSGTLAVKNPDVELGETITSCA